MRSVQENDRSIKITIILKKTHFMVAESGRGFCFQEGGKGFESESEGCSGVCLAGRCEGVANDSRH